MSGRFIRWIVVLLLMLAAAGGMALLASRGRESVESWRRAQQAIDDDRFLEAQRHLVAYVTRYGQDSLGHVILARCFRRAPGADFESASHQLQLAEELGGHAALRQFERDLLSYQWFGMSTEREDRLLDYAEARPDDAPLVYEALARGAIADRRLNAANQWLDRWVKEYPEDPWARLWRGTLFQHMDRPQLAIEDYRVVYAQRPTDLEVAKRLGIVLATSGYDYQEAEERLNAYLDEHPDDPDALAALAHCQRAAGRTEEARNTVARALKSEPRHADALMTKALVELELDLPEEALETVRKFQEIARDFESEAAYQQLLAQQPVLGQPHLTQRAEELLQLEAKVLRRLGQEEEARERLERLAAIQRDVAGLKRMLGQYPERRDDSDLIYRILQTYLRLERPKEAQAWLRHLEEANALDTRIGDADQAIRAQLQEPVRTAD